MSKSNVKVPSQRARDFVMRWFLHLTPMPRPAFIAHQSQGYLATAAGHAVLAVYSMC